MGAVVLVLALVGGGVATAILLGGDDDPSSGRDRPTASDSTTTPAAEPIDPAVFEATLRELSTPILDDAATADLSVRSWSTAQDNLEEGRPRLLSGAERAEGTEWYLEDSRGGVTTSHLPPDARDHYVPGTCNAELVGCEEFTTEDGRPGIDYWQAHPEGWVHQVVVDTVPGSPLIVVYERVRALESTLRQARSKAVVSTEQMRTTAADPRLQLPLPDPAPDLPSFQACFVENQPADCPEWITPPGS